MLGTFKDGKWKISTSNGPESIRFYNFTFPFKKHRATFSTLLGVTF